MHKLCILVGSILLFVGAGCSATNRLTPVATGTGQITSNAHSTRTSSPDPSTHNLTVFAAASLTGAFQEIGKQFEAAHQGVKVNFNFAGSQILRTQLEQGAIADVYAPADHKNMDLVVADGFVLAGSVRDFATNSLVVILPANNPGKVASLVDLTKPGLKIVLADISVPAGNYARQLLTKLSQDANYGTDFAEKVLSNVVSYETDVEQVVTKIELGEADAGIVYVSDAAAAANVITLAIPDEFNITAHYPITVLAKAPEPNLANEFIAYVTSPEGQEILRKWGFTPYVK